MAKLRIQGDSTGYVDLEAPTNASSSTLDLDQVPQLNKGLGDTFVHNSGKFEIRDSNGYARLTAYSGSAQLGLFRQDAQTVGGMYIGADWNEFRLYDSSFTPRMSVTQAGYVTMPYQPAFRAGGASPDGNVTTNLANKLTWATGVAINRGGFYDSAQQRFNAPVAGIYQFSASFWSQGSSAGDFAPKVNGSYLPSGTADSILFAQQGNGDGIHRNISGTFLLNLNVGDYVELWCRNYTMTFYSGHSWWEGHLVG